MKKSLSIKNSKGIYVARASFSSDETIIDFVKNNNHTSSCDNIVDSTALPIEQNFGSQSIQSLPTSPTKRTKRRNPVHKVLKILHLKRKSSSKMDENVDGDAIASTSSSPRPSSNKIHTATLVKKISIVKKAGEGGMGARKSGIPLRSATSVERISHSMTASSPTTLSTTTATLSVSEMNLVNIDYRQEESSGGGRRDNNLNIDLHVDRRTHFQNIRSKFDGSGGGSGTERAIGGSSKIPTGRIGKTNQLQITISGTKRSSNVKSEEPQLMHHSESLKLRRPTKSNISRGGIAYNTIGVPPAPTTQAPSMPYRITGGKIENAVHTGDDSHTKSVMAATAAASEAAKATPIESIAPSATQTSSKLLTSATATSIDCEDLELIAHPLTPDERRNSLFTELTEAENREPMTKLPDRGRRYPGMAASETIKFQLQTKTNTESVDEAAKALTSVNIPTVRVDSPAKPERHEADEEDVAQSNRMPEDSEKQPTTGIHFEVGKEVRPIITSQTNLRQNISTTYDNEPIEATTFGSMSLRQEYANATQSPNSIVVDRAIPLPPPPSPQSQTETDAHHHPIPIESDTLIADESQNKDYAKPHHRRRIAYIAQTAESTNSPSTSHSIEDDELVATTATTTTTTTATASTAEYSDQFRFDSTLTQFSDTLITDYYHMMPAYGDLVWSDDGVKFTQFTHSHPHPHRQFFTHFFFHSTFVDFKSK